ncbi:MAG: 2Fe-2S iron-sulfur cluster-binding protein [Planctomycetota bacterium]
MPTVTIDGHKVRVRKDATVLDAARKAGIWMRLSGPMHPAGCAWSNWTAASGDR